GIVDEVIGAAALGDEQLLRRRGGGDDLRPLELADLDRGEADAAGGAVDEQRLAALKLSALNEGVIGGQRRDGEARALGEAEAARQRQQPRRRQDDLLGIAAGALTRDHGIADADAGDARRDRGDDASAFDAGNERQRRLELVFAEDRQRVREIDAA